jgi:hypothetical protein
MNVFELALFLAILGAAWFTGKALYAGFGVAGAILGGILGASVVTGAWIAVSRYLDRSSTSKTSH